MNSMMTFLAFAGCIGGLGARGESLASDGPSSACSKE